MIKQFIKHYHLIPIVIEAVVLLAFYRLAIIVLPSRYAQILHGHCRAETIKTSILSPYLHSVKKIITYLAKRIPWKTKCLDQALAAQKMLLRKKLPSTLYIGMIKTNQGWQAHAWVRCGSEWIIGYHPHIQYTVIGTYAKY